MNDQQLTLNNYMGGQTYWYFNDDNYMTLGISVISAALFIVASISIIRKYQNVMHSQMKSIIFMYMSILIFMVFS